MHARRVSVDEGAWKSAVACIARQFSGPSLFGINFFQPEKTMLQHIHMIYPLAAAGYSLIWLLLGGGIPGAILIFIIAKMLGR
jgi:hypothetical protein